MADLIKTIPAAPFVRILKEVLPEGLQINRNGKESLMLASAIFALRLQAIANDICTESKRSTINANDVLRAMEEVELPHLLNVLRNKLQAFRDKKAAARKKIRTTGDMVTTDILPLNIVQTAKITENEDADEQTLNENMNEEDDMDNDIDQDQPNDDELGMLINDSLMEVMNVPQLSSRSGSSNRNDENDDRNGSDREDTTDNEKSRMKISEDHDEDHE